MRGPRRRLCELGRSRLTSGAERKVHRHAWCGPTAVCERFRPARHLTGGVPRGQLDEAPQAVPAVQDARRQWPAYDAVERRVDDPGDRDRDRAGVWHPPHIGLQRRAQCRSQMPGSRNTFPPKRSSVMLRCAASSRTTGPGAVAALATGMPGAVLNAAATPATTRTPRCRCHRVTCIKPPRHARPVRPARSPAEPTAADHTHPGRDKSPIDR